MFFFSSRRRHTRFKCDWSSDVCSSDLLPEIPQHSHAMAASGTTGQATSGNGNLPAAARGHYAQSGNTTMPALLANVGGSQPHLNMPPYLPLSFCMAMQGIFPSQT